MGTEEVCKRCGTRKPDWPPIGPLVSVLDTNATALVHFFRRELDVEKCETCGDPLTAPTIVVSLDNHAEDLIFYSPLAREHPEEITQIEESATADGTTVTAGFDSADALREAAWRRLSPRAAAAFQELGKSLEETPDEAQWELIWPDLTSSTFAAAVVPFQVELSVSTDADVAERISRHTREELLQSLAQLQARVWYSVCSRWKLSSVPSSTLEEDLKTYLDPWAIVNGAPEFFFKSLESLDDETVDPAARYAFEATNATLCTTVGKPNSLATKWAFVYLLVEILRSTSEEGRARVLNALTISEHRARNTVDRKSLASAVAGMLSQQAAKKFQDHSAETTAIQAAVDKAGHPDLLADALSGVQLRTVGGEALSVDEIARLISNAAHDYASQPGELEGFLDLIRQSLPPAISAEEIVTMARQVEETQAENYLARTVIRYSLGRIICMRRQPIPFLDWVGAEPESWEGALPLSYKSVLWLWRARALRLTGRPAQARDLLESLAKESALFPTKLPSHVRQNVLGDLALAYVDLGLYEHALQIETTLLDEPGAGESPWHLRAAATTYTMLGRDVEAVGLLRKALDFATHSHREILPDMQAQLASVLSRCGQVENVLEILDGIATESLSNPEVLINWFIAWVNLPSDAPHSEMRDRVLSTARSAAGNVAELIKSSLAQGDLPLYMTACRLFAATLGHVASENGAEAWKLVDSGARAYEGSPDPVALVALARNAWENGDSNSAREKLLELPETLARRFADTRDVSVSANALLQLGNDFRALGDYVAGSDVALSDARLVGELQRDSLGRIAARATSELQSGFVAPDDEQIARIGGEGYFVGVLEWVSGERGVHWLFSRVSDKGEVASSWLEPPTLDLGLLSKKVNQRLSVWHTDRAGDPFDLSDWKIFENWFVKELEGRLPEGSQLVVIEHQQVANLHWHVAAVPRWRVSYSPSWSALLNPLDRAMPTKEGPIGVAMVPEYHDSATNLRALENSVSCTVDLAGRLGRQAKCALREACDRDALLGVLNSSTVAKVLCHGFVDPDEDVVAFMVAHNGILPLAGSVAANTPAGRRHRFDWRECRRLEGAPAVLFSAACSSGQSHHAGLGEKLGLFSALRRAGTRSFVASRWDIDAEVVLPILDSAMERYLRTGDKLAVALHAACSEAGKEHPRWLAWSLALEGDWK